ncbi:MAG TPA: metal ABC transporter ATP-binding protein [Tenericutes bacterium]|nr:metal ABC transporter ATP-binding protein [Mycoplasmatota bacterium]
MNLIKVNNLYVNYDKKNVLTDVSFEINEKDYITIIGENGSGKSTLIKTILGLTKYNRGNIKYTNINKNEIGFLPQSNQIQNDFPASVFEVVLSGCLNKKGIKPFYSKKDKEIALDNIMKLGILHLKNRPFKELSGGQIQRVLLARALCATTKLLILDEPVSGLDPLVTKDLYNIISRLNKELGITIIMISHDIDNAFENANKILHLNNKVIYYGDTNNYNHSEACLCWLGEKHV